jgi:hypothetical protein
VARDERLGERRTVEGETELRTVRKESVAEWGRREGERESQGGARREALCEQLFSHMRRVIGEHRYILAVGTLFSLLSFLN